MVNAAVENWNVRSKVRPPFSSPSYPAGCLPERLRFEETRICEQEVSPAAIQSVHNSDSIICVGGRVYEADLSFNTRRPIILPAWSSLIDIIVWKAHQDCTNFIKEDLESYRISNGPIFEALAQWMGTLSHQASEIGQKPENPVDDIVMLISSESQSGTGPIALLFKVNPIPGVWLGENYG